MKQKKSKRPTPAAKITRRPKDVDEYLAHLPGPARANLRTMRAAIRSVVPLEAVETISYGIPAFKHKKVLVWFAAFSSHYSLFPTASVIQQFQRELGNFPTSKGTIHFPAATPLPVALIKKIVEARVAQGLSQRRKANAIIPLANPFSLA